MTLRALLISHHHTANERIVKMKPGIDQGMGVKAKAIGSNPIARNATALSITIKNLPRVFQKF